LFKMGYIVLSAQQQIFTYYCAFCFLETINIASGIGVIIKVEKVVTYNGVPSIKVLGAESAYDMQGFIQNWNMSIGIWLKHYVYFRLDGQTSKRWLPSFAAFMVSALLHGVMPRLWYFYV